jgi:CPA2 family monovalent cation:H+ antiporter-2
MDSWGLLIEIVVLLAACLAAGAMLSYLRQSPLVGYLLAGMLLGGPGSLGLIHAETDIEAIAELGVALLLFSLGLEFSWRRLKGLGAATLMAGAAQVFITGLIAALVAAGFGLGAVEAVAVGAMLSLSSTAAVLRLLMDRGEVDSFHGRNAIAILLVQDMAVVPLAILMTLLAGGGSPGQIAFDVAKVVGLAGGLVGLLYVLVNHVFVAALGHLSVEKNRELTILLAVVVGLGSTWAAHAVGLSAALGAFVAGMFLGSSRFAVQIRADVSSLRVVLLTLFFGAVGMVADPIWIAQNLAMVLAIAALIMSAKAVIVGIILRGIGQPLGASLATGLCLGQVGEFAFVLGSAGKAGGIVTDETYMVIVSSAIVSLLLTPYLVGLAPPMALAMERLRQRLGRPPTLQSQEPDDHGIRPDVIIVGFGPAGQAVGHALVKSPWSVLVLDLNPTAEKAAEAIGLNGHIGDATQIEVLEHVGARFAKLVVITLPARLGALTILEHVRQLAPAAHVVVRSRYQLHTSDFETAGAHAVIGDEEQVGARLSEHVLTQLTELQTHPPDPAQPLTP